MLNDPFNDDHPDVLDEFIYENYLDEGGDDLVPEQQPDLVEDSNPDIPAQDLVFDEHKDFFSEEAPVGDAMEDSSGGLERVSEDSAAVPDISGDIIFELPPNEEDAAIDSVVDAHLEDSRIERDNQKDYLEDRGPTIYVDGLGDAYVEDYDQVLEDAKKQDKNYDSPKIDPAPHFKMRARRNPRTYGSPDYQQRRAMRGGYIRNHNRYKR